MGVILFFDDDRPVLLSKHLLHPICQCHSLMDNNYLNQIVIAYWFLRRSKDNLPRLRLRKLHEMKCLKTSMHSSRMRTARFGGHVNRMTDRCKTLPCPKHRLLAVNIWKTPFLFRGHWNPCLTCIGNALWIAVGVDPLSCVDVILLHLNHWTVGPHHR